MISILINITNLGTNSSNDEETNEIVRLVNGISLLGVPICIFYITLFLIKGYLGLTTLFIVGLPVFVLPILFNYLGKHSLSKIGLIILSPIFFLIVTVLLGRESGFYLSFLVITAPPALFFKSIKKALPFMWFAIICFILSFVGIGLYNPDNNLPFAMMIYIVNLFMVLFTQVVLVVFFKLEISKNRSKLREKNIEITDSIKYAKRIQNAILPPKKVVKEYLKDCFILYKPKDIVAGDFYWLEQKDQKVLFAAADCTGHGVPGAMVSVVCNNGLNRSVREYGLTDPGEILNKTREIVVQEFEKSEEEVKDGMDIALCSLERNKLQYAGAHNPLWIIRKDSLEVEEIKANKQPIGQFDKPEPYTTHTIELQKGDSFYVFSDGYADQFGGEKGKKLKTANFKKLLLSIQKEPMEKQKQLIDEAFENWKGDLEQLDDVCVIGVRI